MRTKAGIAKLHLQSQDSRGTIPAAFSFVTDFRCVLYNPAYHQSTHSDFVTLVIAHSSLFRIGTEVLPMFNTINSILDPFTPFSICCTTFRFPRKIGQVFQRCCLITALITANHNSTVVSEFVMTRFLT